MKNPGRGCWWLLLMGLVLSGCAPTPYVVVTPLGSRPLERPAIVVTEVVDGIPADVPVSDHPTPEALGKLRGYLFKDLNDLEMQQAGIVSVRGPKMSPFSTVAFGSSDSTVADKTLLVSARVLSYKHGSRAARYFIGFGAGKGEVLVQLKIREQGRPDDVFVGNFKGAITGGVFGGSEDVPFHAVSENFAEMLRKNWK